MNITLHTVPTHAQMDALRKALNALHGYPHGIPIGDPVPDDLRAAHHRLNPARLIEAAVHVHLDGSLTITFSDTV